VNKDDSPDRINFYQTERKSLFFNDLRVLRPNKKNMCVYGFLLSEKPEIVFLGSGIRYFIFEISGKPSFVEAVL
jgi:hypothetical protein